MIAVRRKADPLPTRLDTTSATFDTEFASFLATPRGDTGDVSAPVRAILDDVRRRGPAALVELTERFDGLALETETLETDLIDLDALAADCPAKLRAAVDFAHDRIATYHAAQRPDDHRFIDHEGVELGWRWTPIGAVGVYVPGGRASYPSSVLMNVVPARIAGVERIAMVAPAPGGVLNPAVAYAARKAGVTEFWPVGGAQAVAALAFGCGPIRPVDKIVGPGNAYVAEAKRQVFGTVGIDTIAGPSEILVIADGENDPAWIAADLLSQSEHDPASQSILVTPDAGFAARAVEAVESQLAGLDTEAVAREAWEKNGAVIITESLEQACALSDLVAPEHLELAVADPDALLSHIRHAGAIFMGRMTPEALGDYVTGSNHVLPTSRAARFASGLGLLDFMKRTSLQRAGAEGFAALSQAALTLAEAEGLPAHALSVAIRSNRGGD